MRNVRNFRRRPRSIVCLLGALSLLTACLAPLHPERGNATPEAGPIPSSTSGNTSPPSTGTSGSDRETIKIWSSLPRSVSAKAETDPVVAALKLRFEQAGNQLCNGRFALKYEDRDDSTHDTPDGDATTELQNAHAAATDPDVLVYIGPWNAILTKLALPVLNGAGLLTIGLNSGYPGFTKGGLGGPNEPDMYSPSGIHTFVRVTMTDDVQAVAAAHWAVNGGVKSTFILDDQTVYGVGVANIFAARATELGITTTGRSSVAGTAIDFLALASRIIATHPDLVYLSSTDRVNPPKVVENLRLAGYKGKLMITGNLATAGMILRSGMANAVGMTATVPGLVESELGEKAKTFLQKYQDTTGTPATESAILGYETANLILQALNQVCSTDRAKVRSAIFGIKNVDGILGPWHFDANGDTTLDSVKGYEVKDGAWVLTSLYQNGKWRTLLSPTASGSTPDTSR